MTERLLQFIWQFQYFNKNELTTTTGDSVQIIAAGQYNTNQGPDFLQSRIIINHTNWAGNIELHVKTSDWHLHQHQNDKNYNNVILHVVWENDTTESPNALPILELKDRVSKILLQRYEDWMHSTTFIPCEKSIHLVNDITWQSWKERLLAERLIRKSALIEQSLLQNNYHWEETFWWQLARNFGIKINADAFEAIAKSISVNILAKHKNQVHQLEALLFGQAGLLNEDFTEDYPKLLQREYKFLHSKYNLQPIHIPVHFLRMRPGNFPSVRLAQLAILIQASTHLFSKIKDAASAEEVKSWLQVTANDYWHYHYRFDEAVSYKKKKLGTVMIDNILINTVAPVLFAYGNYQNDNSCKTKAIKFLESTSAEKNSITKGFEKLGVGNKNAFDSQSLIELKSEYCTKKKCLECSIGNAILKR
jgi:hypothetical protein